MFLDTTSDVATRVTGAIRDAARVTGAGFDYLLKTALRESNFNPELKAPTSSATGLFQFIDQTWLATLKTAGPGVGYGRYADAITKTSSGRYVVSDPAAYQEIMRLRKDPAANALMAGAFTTRNAAELREALGRKPTDGELYMAHFFGASGAARFIAAAEKTPNATAALSFPEAARANRSIFYTRFGIGRSMKEVYDKLARLHDTSAVPQVAGAMPSSTTTFASPPAAPKTEAAAAVAPVQSVQASTPAPNASAKARDGLPMFHDLFRSGQRAGVGEGVAALWGSPRPPLVQVAAAAPAVSAVTQAPAATGAPLDLSSFLRAEIRASLRRAL